MKVPTTTSKDKADAPNMDGVMAEAVYGSEGIPRLPDGRVLEPGMHWREDRSGRRYFYDRHGNRIFREPFRGSLRQRDIPLSEWLKLTP